MRFESKRLLAAATAVAALVMTTACGGGGGGDQAQPATTSPSVHSGHTFSAPPAAPLRAGERFLTLTMPQPYAPSAPNGGTDEYRCFIVDPELTSAAYLTGSQFLPQNADIVHHAIFFRIPPEAAAEAHQLDEKAPGEGWQCFGGSGVGDDSWVAHWAPGANEVLLRPGLGYPMPPGSLLVMQVHYNLLTVTGTGNTDQSGIRLRLADSSSKMTGLDTFTLPAPVELPCTAQESGPLCDRTAAIADVQRRFGDDVAGTIDDLVQVCEHGKPVPGPVQHCDHKIEGASGTIYAIAGHMHLLGRSIRIELNPGTPGARTLLDIPMYNFDDQAIRPLAEPVQIRSGDVLRVTCTHDAGVRKLLPQLQPLPPRYVVWGDGTSDEMCLGIAIGTINQ